jgi:hypothetical protein
VRWWVAIALVAGCGHPHGVGIKVTVTDPTSSVELFVGDGIVTDPGSCQTGAGCRIGPPPTNGGSGYIYGSGWSMSATIADYNDRVERNTVEFRIEPPASGATTVPAVLLVGYDEGGSVVADRVLHDVAISNREVEIDTTLQSATGDLSADGERALVWRKPSDPGFALSACAAVEHADGTTEFFSPNDDHDCDGAILNDPNMPECNASTAFEWCGASGRGITEADCITSTPGTPSSCRLAGPGCVDMSPGCPMKSSTCTPTSPVACLPPEVCRGVQQMPVPCNSFDVSCVGLVTATTTMPMPRITCPMGAYASTMCPATIDLSVLQLGPLLLNRTCSALALATISTPLMLGPSVTLASGTVSLLPTPLPTGPCTMDVHTSTPLNSRGELVLDIQTGSEHRMIPLEISYTMVSTCPAKSSPCMMDSAVTTYVCP